MRVLVLGAVGGSFGGRLPEAGRDVTSSFAPAGRRNRRSTASSSVARAATRA